LPALFTPRTAGGLATTVAATALTLSACSSSTSSSAAASSGSTQTSASGGTYNIGLITPTGGINPLTTTQYDTMFAVGPRYEGRWPELASILAAHRTDPIGAL
jgi:hypothetical protein